MNIVRGMTCAMLAACLAAAKASADNSAGAPASPPAPQQQAPDLSKTIYSPAQTAIAAKQPIAPGGGQSKTPDLPPPQDLPGASQPAQLPDNNPMEQLDPDGVPLAISQRQKPNPDQSMIDAYLKQQQAVAEQNKDWLLRSYEQKLQEHQAKNGDQTPNLYFELSSNKELAELAGLPYTGDSPNGASLRTNDTAQDDPNGTALRKDTEGSDNAPKSKPIIDWKSSAPAGIAAPLPFALSSSFDNVVPTVSTQKVDEAQEASDLATPGAVSAKGDDPNATSPDLTLDMLPGESMEHALQHQDTDSAAELSLPMSSTLLHKEEATETQVAPLSKPETLGNTATTAPLAPPPSSLQKTPEYDPNAPVPVSQVPQPSSRPALANPFDILNR